MRLLIFLALVGLACGAPVENEAPTPEAPAKMPALEALAAAPASTEESPAPEAAVPEQLPEAPPAEEITTKEALVPLAPAEDEEELILDPPPIEQLPEDRAEQIPIVEPLAGAPAIHEDPEPDFFDEILSIFFGDIDDDTKITPHSSSVPPTPAMYNVEPYHAEGAAVYMRWGD